MTRRPSEESTLDVRERELRHMAAQLEAARGESKHWCDHATKLVADLIKADESMAALRHALGDALARFKALHRIAVNPMKSWDAGAVIDAQRVEDETGDALDAIGLAFAAVGGAGPCELCGTRITANGTQCSPACPADSRFKHAL